MSILTFTQPSVNPPCSIATERCRRELVSEPIEIHTHGFEDRPHVRRQWRDAPDTRETFDALDDLRAEMSQPGEYEVEAGV